jgi:hypothetical protein
MTFGALSAASAVRRSFTGHRAGNSHPTHDNNNDDDDDEDEDDRRDSRRTDVTLNQLTET